MSENWLQTNLGVFLGDQGLDRNSDSDSCLGWELRRMPGCRAARGK